MMKVLVTGWAGFIGSNLVRYLLDHTDWEIVGLDNHTYASRPLWVYQKAFTNKYKSRFSDLRGDIRKSTTCEEAITQAEPDVVIHLAAESHVCRSLEGPRLFAETNMMGTFNMLEAVRKVDPTILFHHVSTDEVFGELGEDGKFDELTKYEPRSPYSATKAASDHLVMAYHHSYGINTRVTNCSNNFGANQHEEKLIPKTIIKTLKGEPITIYGSGTQVRDWIWVEDHCAGIHASIVRGAAGAQFLFGGECERSNLDIVSEVWEAVMEVSTEDGFDVPERRLVHTNDRPTDDQRYAIDCSLARHALEWEPRPDLFKERLKETVRWYRRHES